MDPYVGKYFSIDYMRRQVLKQTEQEIKEIDEQIDAEREAGLILDPNAEMDPSMDPSNAPPADDMSAQEAPVEIDAGDARRGEF